MKKQKIYIIAALFIIIGCNKEEVRIDTINEGTTIEQLEKTKTISIFAEMPDEPSTRVALAKEVDNSIKLTWEENDELQLCFVQNGNKVKQVVTVNNITNEGKKASFNVDIPSEFGDANFDLYGVYGGGGLKDDNPTMAILPTISSTASSLSTLAHSEYTMLHFSAKDITESSNISVIFQHIGSLFCLTLKNTSVSAIENMGEARITSTTGGWAYNSTESGMGFDLVTEAFHDVETAGSYISLYADGVISADNTLSFWGWYPPLPNVNWPELTLQLYDKNNVLIETSSNAKPARTVPTEAGKCFYFYAVKNDGGLHFTDYTYTAPLNIEDLTIEGDLRHADSGTDFIGMVFTRAGNVYYNQAQLNGEWVGEINLGIGTDPRIAIDGNNKPHVVYVDDGKIAYRMNDGNGYSAPIYIVSNNGGRCSKPDIAVDAGGFVHITYSDTKGNTGAYRDKDDIMYAVNSSGTFVKTLMYDGRYDHWGGADASGSYYERGSRIALDGIGQYYIFTRLYAYYKWMSGNDKTYSIQIKSVSSSGSVTASSASEVYDIAFDGTNVVVFYKTANTTISTAKLTIGDDDNITFTDIEQVASSLSNNNINPATLLALPSTRVLGGISGGKVFMKHGVEEEVTDRSVKSGTVVVPTACGGSIYTLYTDSSDGMIRFIKR